MVRGALFKERVSPSKKVQKRLKNVKESFSQDPAQCENNFSNPLVDEPFKKRMKLPIRRPNETLNQLSEDDDFEEETLAVRRDRLKQKKFESMNAEKLPKPAPKPRKRKEKVACAPVLKSVDAEIRRCKGKAKVTETEDLSSDSGNDNNAKKNNAKGKAKMVDEHIQIISDSDDGSLPSIKWRGHLEKFVDALRGLSDVQRGLLEEAGFGSLFNLTAFEMPEFLCRYLVEQYNPMKGQINLADGCVLEFSEKDVEICLGIPREKAKVVKIDSSIKFQVVKDWRAHHDKENHDIRYGDVVKKMGDSKNDGTNFLIDFVVLFHSCIVEPTQSGACNQTLVRSLEGITPGDLKKMNWCGFVIKTLVDAKLRWLKNRNAPFTGCLPFLTVLYLDRVVLFNQRAVPRKNPAFIGWTQRLIAERENIEIQYGCFGCGKVKAQQQINRLEKNATLEEADDARPNEVFNREMGKVLKDLANVIVKIGEINKKARNECQEDDFSKALVDTTKILLGLEIDPLHDTDPDVSTQLGNAVSASQDPFWTNPELIKMVEEIEAAISIRKGFIRDGFDGHCYEKGYYSGKDAQYVVEQEVPFNISKDDPVTTIVHGAADFTTATVLPSASVPPLSTTTFDVDLQGVLHDIVAEHCVPQIQIEEATINTMPATKEQKKKKVAEVKGVVRKSGRDRQPPNRYY